MKTNFIANINYLFSLLEKVKENAALHKLCNTALRSIRNCLFYRKIAY